MLQIGSIVLGVDDIDRAVTFWCAALDYVPSYESDDNTFTVLVSRSAEGPQLALDRSETPIQLEPRMHLDLFASDAQDQAAEVERLVGLGATVVDWDRYPEDPDFVVLADTEGNRFCVIDPLHNAGY